MRIGDLEQHCGDCKLLDLCGEPFDDVMLCANENLADMTEDEYTEKVKEIRCRSEKNWSNATLEKMVCRAVGRSRG
ncbi:MAG: hypothetical protein J6C37_03940 [Roseburia sp.]|nr:hypothetical protein [Roseburia sp.]